MRRWDITAEQTMKKLFLGVALALLAVAMMAQQTFTGTTVLKTNMHYEDNFDVIVENFKSNVDKDTTIDAGMKGMVKMMAKGIVKNVLKQQEVQKYITALPEGEYTTINYWDGPNNRISAFTPELGRVMIWDQNEGTLIVAYPNLKTALKVTDPAYKSTQFLTSASYRPSDPNAEVTEINGFRAVPNFGTVAKETMPDSEGETIVLGGVEYVKVPAAGYILENYGILVQQTMSKEYFTQEQNLVTCKQAPAVAANYQLPDGYKIVTTADALVKSLKKAIKSNGLAIPCDADNVPENLWSIFK